MSTAADPAADSASAAPVPGASASPARGPSPVDDARVALVTGAGRRLGRAIALGLAGAGWDVAVHYRSSAAEADATVADLAALGVRAAAFAADLADEAEVDALFDAVRDRLGVPRCLVNSASLFDHDAPASASFGMLARHVAPNLAAPLRLSARMHAALPDDARGVVVHLLDQKLAAPNPDFFSYTLTKAALAAALPMQAMAFAPKLRVVGVSPGLTLPSHLQTDEQFERAHAATALLDRSSRPDDIVAAVLALVANPAITGQNLVVDGGQHLMRLARDVSFLP